MKGLSPEAIEALLNKKSTSSSKIKSTTDGWKPLNVRQNDPLYRQQIGPVVYHENKSYCVSGRFREINGVEERFDCGSPTYITFQGIPYCATHCLQLANQMLVAKGVLS